MLKKSLFVLFLLFSLSGFSQSKVGTIDIDFIVSKMPELTTVQANLEAYGKTLDADLQKKFQSYDSLVKVYQEQEATYSEEMKKEKQTEILTLEDDIAKFRQNGGQLINLKKDEEMRPLYQKIGAALDKVAKAQGYTQIFQIDESLVYIDPTYDVTIAVCAELGITVTE